MDAGLRDLVADALRELGKRRFVLSVHGESFPCDPDEDLGAGAASSAASERLFAFVRELGFSGMQLGPLGAIARDHASPYDGAMFARALTAIGKRMFAPGGALAGLVAERTLAGLGGDGGDIADHRRAHDVTRALLTEAAAAFANGARPDFGPRLEAFVARHRGWLERWFSYRVLAEQHGATPATWPEPDATLWHDDAPARLARRAEIVDRHAPTFAAFAFGQLAAHAAHEQVRATARALGLALYADMHIGSAPADTWAFAPAFLPGYALGAPPSRTNPEGQPWGYPVLHPERRAPGGAAFALVRARLDAALGEHDGLRVDHPHGLVCPWVYRPGALDAARAVRDGARLFESPDLPDHPELAGFAIARPEQIDRAQPRHADGWVRDLDDQQVDRYALLLEEMLAAVRRHGRDAGDVTCEVLSTLPHPLARVLGKHGLGRWRVLQKANLDDPRDVYRSENAVPADWVMLGNHDTASIVGLWSGWDDARRARWATHLTARLGLSTAAAPALVAAPGTLASAMLAELLVCPAESVLVFFADLFGYQGRFNVPGTISEHNWRLRLPSAFAERYDRELAARRALNLPLACALALRARHSPRADLIRRLSESAAAAGTPPPEAAAAG